MNSGSTKLVCDPAPATLYDLAGHRCINYRLATAGGPYLWEFEQDSRPLQVRVDGLLVFNDTDLFLDAALAGQGIALLFEDQVAVHVAAGRLVPVPAQRCWTAPGYYLHYTSRRQAPPALAALVEALRHQPA